MLATYIYVLMGVSLTHYIVLFSTNLYRFSLINMFVWSQEKRRSKDMETTTEADLLSQSDAAPLSQSDAAPSPRPQDEGTADLTSSLLQLLRDHSTRRSTSCQGDDIEIVGNENNPFLGTKNYIMIRVLMVIFIRHCLSELSIDTSGCTATFLFQNNSFVPTVDCIEWRPKFNISEHSVEGHVSVLQR